MLCKIHYFRTIFLCLRADFLLLNFLYKFRIGPVSRLRRVEQRRYVWRVTIARVSDEEAGCKESDSIKARWRVVAVEWWLVADV